MRAKIGIFDEISAKKGSAHRNEKRIIDVLASSLTCCAIRLEPNGFPHKRVHLIRPSFQTRFGSNQKMYDRSLAETRWLGDENQGNGDTWSLDLPQARLLFE